MECVDHGDTVATVMSLKVWSPAQPLSAPLSREHLAKTLTGTGHVNVRIIVTGGGESCNHNIGHITCQ